MNYTLGHLGHRGELGYPRYQRLPHPYIRDAALDRQLFIYLEQLEEIDNLGDTKL